jgi:hypothetical protein
MNDNFVTEYLVGIQRRTNREFRGLVAQLRASYFVNRYTKQSSDLHNAVKSIPYFHYETLKIFIKPPKGARLVGVELDDEPTVDLKLLTSSRRCVYLLGTGG